MWRENEIKKSEAGRNWSGGEGEGGRCTEVHDVVDVVEGVELAPVDLPRDAQRPPHRFLFLSPAGSRARAAQPHHSRPPENRSHRRRRRRAAAPRDRSRRAAAAPESVHCCVVFKNSIFWLLRTNKIK